MEHGAIQQKAIAAYEARKAEAQRIADAVRASRGLAQRESYDKDASHLYDTLRAIGIEEASSVPLDPVPEGAFSGEHGAYPPPSVTICGVRLQRSGGTAMREVFECPDCGGDISGRTICNLADLGRVFAEPAPVVEHGC